MTMDDSTNLFLSLVRAEIEKDLIRLIALAGDQPAAHVVLQHIVRRDARGGRRPEMPQKKAIAVRHSHAYMSPHTREFPLQDGNGHRNLILQLIHVLHVVIPPSYQVYHGQAV